MARIGTFDLGSTYQAAQQAQANKLKLEAAGIELEEQKNILKNRKKAEDIRRRFAEMPDQIMALEISGMHKEAAQLRDHYIKTRKNTIEMIGREGPLIAEEDYKGYRQDLINIGAITGDMMPREYRPGWWKEREKQEKGELRTLTRQWAKDGAVMSQDLVTQDGEIIWEGSPYKKPTMQKGYGRGGGSSKPWQMTASDTNAIRHSAAQLYGSIWDPRTGRYGGLNKDQEMEVASIAERASKIYNEGKGQIPHSSAVAQAAREMQINIPAIKNNDPAGIR